MTHLYKHDLSKGVPFFKGTIPSQVIRTVTSTDIELDRVENFFNPLIREFATRLIRSLPKQQGVTQKDEDILSAIDFKKAYGYGEYPSNAVYHALRFVLVRTRNVDQWESWLTFKPELLDREYDTIKWERAGNACVKKLSTGGEVMAVETELSWEQRCALYEQARGVRPINESQVDLEGIPKSRLDLYFNPNVKLGKTLTTYTPELTGFLISYWSLIAQLICHSFNIYPGTLETYSPFLESPLRQYCTRKVKVDYKHHQFTVYDYGDIHL